MGCNARHRGEYCSGMGLVQLLREQTSLPVFGNHPKDDKETRLSRHQGRFEAGRILLPVDAPWLADFENELLAFPSGRYDDQVDALLLFLDWFSKNEHCLTPSSPRRLLFTESELVSAICHLFLRQACTPVEESTASDRSPGTNKKMDSNGL
jgi:hypothetical protein